MQEQLILLNICPIGNFAAHLLYSDDNLHLFENLDSDKLLSRLYYNFVIKTTEVVIHVAM